MPEKPNALPGAALLHREGASHQSSSVPVTSTDSFTSANAPAL